MAFVSVLEKGRRCTEWEKRACFGLAVVEYGY